MTSPRHPTFAEAPPRAVTFDYWDTLVVSRRSGPREARRAALEALLVEFGVGVDAGTLDAALDAAVAAHNDHWHANRQFSAADGAVVLIDTLGLALDPTDRDRVAETFVHAPTGLRPELTPGAVELLGSLSDAGIRIGIVCDVGLTPSPVLRDYLDRHGVLTLFDHWSFSDEVGVYKPDPVIFHHALAGLGGVAPAETVHVGDLRRTDVAGARAVGMGTVRYAGLHDDGPDQGPEADLVVRHHLDLIGALGV